MRSLRLWAVLRLARLLGVPVQVGYSFMAFGKNAKKPSPGELI
jgi:hypothetical protein